MANGVSEAMPSQQQNNPATSMCALARVKANGGSLNRQERSRVYEH
jgi:hypothetical protein